MGLLANLFTKGAGDAVKGTLEGAGSLVKDLRSAITGKIDPEKQAELEAKTLELEAQISSAMNQVNLAEAQNKSVFVSGWRPFVGWTCGVAFCYNFVLAPLIVQLVRIWIPAFALVELDMGGIIGVLMGMLGMAGWRTLEKTQGVARS